MKTLCSRVSRINPIVNTGFERWGSRTRMLRGLRQLKTAELVRIVKAYLGDPPGDADYKEEFELSVRLLCQRVKQ